MLEHLAAKLPISRLQRDLTDSTVTRNIGVPLAHIDHRLKSLLRGLDKLMIGTEAIRRDLEANWAVVAEGIQTVLRREGYPKPYEALRGLTRTHAAHRPEGRVTRPIHFCRQQRVQQVGSSRQRPGTGGALSSTLEDITVFARETSVAGIGPDLPRRFPAGHADAAWGGWKQNNPHSANNCIENSKGGR
jgi:hypothetical protein